MNALNKYKGKVYPTNCDYFPFKDSIRFFCVWLNLCMSTKKTK